MNHTHHNRTGADAQAPCDCREPDSNDRDASDLERQSRGAAMAAHARIVKFGAGYKVPAQTTSGKSYMVNLDKRSCTCPDFDNWQQPCKHIYAVESFIQREEQADSNTAESETRRATYRQNWSAYNRAQTIEQELFRKLLRALCDMIPQPEHKMGRPRLPLSDMIF